MTRHLRLATAPYLSINYPDCDACEVQVDDYGDGFTCPSCGTQWDYGDSESIPGKMPEDLPGPVCPNNWAWRVSHLSGEERDRAVISYIKELG